MPNKRKRRIRWALILPLFGIIASLCTLAYYPLAEYIDSVRRENIIARLDLDSEETVSSRKQLLFQQAHAWNDLLARETPPIDPTEIWPYDQQLVVSTQNAPFAWIKIPKIDLQMPIYHTVDKGALDHGAGHMESSSLPVGGKSTHTVLSAHSGMPGSQAFDDIRQLEPGDYFGICVLNEWIGYQVDSIEVVLPWQTQSLDIVEGEDLATLVTCTPYGINDHRLLVHAKRADLPDDFFEQQESLEQKVTDRRNWPLLAAMAASAIAAAVIWIISRNGRKKRQKQQKHGKKAKP